MSKGQGEKKEQERRGDQHDERDREGMERGVDDEQRRQHDEDGPSVDKEAAGRSNRSQPGR